jgi:hypothetical protein
MNNFSSFFTIGAQSILKFLKKPGLSYKGNWIPVFPNTVLDSWHVGDFSTASYLITVEHQSNKKEVMHVNVVARPDQASYNVFGRTSIDDELIILEASVSNSIFSLKASPSDPLFTGAKITMLVFYGETINPLTPAMPITIGPGFEAGTGGNTEGGGGTSGGITSFLQLSGSIGISQISNGLITPNKLNLNAALTPTANETYDLGSNTFRWRDLYLSGNSIRLGDATISASGSNIVLPVGTTVGGAAISTTNSFSSIAVSGQSSIEADSVSDILTLVAGPNITITTNAGSDTITISATTGGSSSGVSTGTANRLAYYASTGAVVQDTGAGLTWSGTNLNVTGTVTATGDVSYVRAYFDTLAELQAVSASVWHGMVAHVHENGGRMYFAHSGAWQPMSNFSDLNIFKTIAVAGQASIVADSALDTLTLVAGTNVTITTDATTDTITINATAGGSAGNLDSLTDVVITTPTTNQVLKYNGTNWINDTDATSAGAGGGTVTSVSGTGTVNGLTLTGTVTTTGSLTLGGTLSGIGNTQLTNSTISGVALGGSLLNLTAGTGVSFSSGTTYNGSAAITINATASSSSISWSLSANGSSDYIFSGPGIITGNTNDPVLYLYRGFSYTFVNTTGGSHPFAIRTSSTSGVDYTSGVSGSQTGTQIFVVPMNAPSTLYYICTAHSNMGNVINIV